MLSSDENEDDSQLREIQEVPQYASSTTDGSGVPETEEITRDTGSANGDSGLPDADEISQDTISGTEDIRHCKTGEVSQDAGFTTDHFSLCEAGGISQGSGSATDDSKCCKMAEILQDDSSDTDSTDEQNNVQEANVINIQKTGPGQIGNHNTYISRPKCVVINQYNHKENTEPPPPYNEQGIEPSEPELHVQRMDNLKSDYERTFDGHQSSLEMYQCTDSKTYERETSGLRMATLKSCADCKVTGQCDNEEEVMDDDFSEQSRLLYVRFVKDNFHLLEN